MCGLRVGAPSSPARGVCPGTAQVDGYPRTHRLSPPARPHAEKFVLKETKQEVRGGSEAALTVCLGLWGSLGGPPASPCSHLHRTGWRRSRVPARLPGGGGSLRPGGGEEIKGTRGQRLALGCPRYGARESLAPCARPQSSLRQAEVPHCPLAATPAAWGEGDASVHLRPPLAAWAGVWGACPAWERGSPRPGPFLPDLSLTSAPQAPPTL